MHERLGKVGAGTVCDPCLSGAHKSLLQIKRERGPKSIRDETVI